MAFEHIDYLVELREKSSQNQYKDVIIFDRGYPSAILI